MKLTKIREWFKEKHTKNLKNDQNYCRLNIEIDICTEPMLEMCPYGTYVLLGSLKHVLKGRNVLLRSLESLTSMYKFAMWTVTVSLSCVGVDEIVSLDGYCCWRLMWSFWGLERNGFWWIFQHLVKNAMF